MFTIVKNRLADKPTSQDHHDHHAGYLTLDVSKPRFDKVIRETNVNQRRMKAASQTRMPAFTHRSKSFFNEPDFKIGSRHRDFTPDKLGFDAKIHGPIKDITR